MLLQARDMYDKQQWLSAFRSITTMNRQYLYISFFFVCSLCIETLFFSYSSSSFYCAVYLSTRDIITSMN